MFEHLAVLDIGDVETGLANEEIEIQNNNDKVEILLSSLWSKEIEDIVEKAKASFANCQWPSRQRRKKDFGNDFLLETDELFD